MNKEEVHTIDALFTAIKQSFHDKQPKVSKLEYVLNFRDWLKPFLRSPSYHTEPHAYKFEMNDQNDACVWFKRFAMDNEWVELGTMLPNLTEGVPSLVRFTWAKQTDIEEITKNVETCQFKFSSETVQWWNNFLQEFKKSQQ